MKYILLGILAASMFWSCGGDYVEPKDMQAMMDSLNQVNSVFYTKYVTTDGKHFAERPTQFVMSDSTLEVSTGNCPMVYDLYEGGAKGATMSTAWNSTGYVENVSIKVEKNGNKFSSIQLNDHLFTNSPVPVSEEVVVNKVRTYIVKKGDNATKLGTFIPKDKIPNKLIIGHKITY